MSSYMWPVRVSNLLLDIWWWYAREMLWLWWCWWCRCCLTTLSLSFDFAVWFYYVCCEIRGRSERETKLPRNTNIINMCSFSSLLCLILYFVSFASCDFFFFSQNAGTRTSLIFFAFTQTHFRIDRWMCTLYIHLNALRAVVVVPLRRTALFHVSYGPLAMWYTLSSTLFHPIFLFLAQLHGM